MKEKNRIKGHSNFLSDTRYYILTGSSGCPSADYMYMSKKVIGGGVIPEFKESSANEYPKG